MKKVIFGFSLWALVFFFACQKQGSTPIATDVDCSTVTYTGTIAPLIARSCGGSSCHGSNGFEGDMTTYTKLIRYVNNGRFEREVLDRQTMPKNSRLTSEELGQIQCWIDNGAQDN
ncbi:MAG: hypothetical protein H6558_19915 [Lewinellaceae bacterium]|nr:hypothetical protein [Lewinellaceae bacterium]